jgi:hypothetical protein
MPDSCSWTCKNCGEVVTAENNIELALDILDHVSGCC